MLPNIVIMDKEFPVYALAALIGFFALVLTVYKLAKKQGLDEIVMLNTVLFGGIGILVGSHLLYGITNFKLLCRVISDVGKEDFSTVVDGLAFVFGGAVFYGGLIGAIFMGFLYLKRKNVAVADYTDIATVGIPIFHFFGRIGCFLGGCCYGVESSMGFVYHYSPVEEANGVRRFPVQLTEAAINLLLFVLLIWLLKKKKAKGLLLNVYLFLYPVCRFILEYFRGDDYRGFIFKLSTSQFISVLLIIRSIAAWWYRSTTNKKQKLFPSD